MDPPAVFSSPTPEGWPARGTRVTPDRGPRGVPGGGQLTLALHGITAASGTLSFFRTLSPAP